MAGRRPTIADVAQRAGVSKGAVSFALNGRPGVAEATRVRIQQAAHDLGWHPSTRARALSRSRSFALGLVMSRPPQLLVADPFFAPFLAGVETTLAEHGFALVLQVVGSDPAAEAGSYRRLAAEGRVDGVFLTDLRSHDPRFGVLVELGLPAVAVGQPSGPCPFPSVSIDDGQALAALVHHLAALGHRRIAHVAGPPGYVHSVARRRAWRRALRDAGLQPGPVVAADFSGPRGAAATRRLLRSPQPPTAVAYANDVMAIAGIGAAAELGLKVPWDLSVTGFDDAPLAAHVTPALTTAGQDVIGWGRVAAQMLLAVVAGEPVGDVTLPPAHPVLRASTGRPPL